MQCFFYFKRPNFKNIDMFCDMITENGFNKLSDQKIENQFLAIHFELKFKRKLRSGLHELNFEKKLV